MNKLLKALILLIAITIYHHSNGQFVKNVGLKSGVGLSNQKWNYENASLSKYYSWQDNKTGFIGLCFIETPLSEKFTLRTSLGYIQKGFFDKEVYQITGPEARVKDPNVIFHNLTLDIAVNYSPFKGNTLNPYFFLGLRNEYRIAVRGAIVEFMGNEIEMNASMYDRFNKYTLSGVIGIGLLFKNIIFMDLEYNPAITNLYKSDLLTIKGSYASAT